MRSWVRIWIAISLLGCLCAIWIARATYQELEHASDIELQSNIANATWRTQLDCAHQPKNTDPKAGLSDCDIGLGLDEPLDTYVQKFKKLREAETPKNFYKAVVDAATVAALISMGTGVVVFMHSWLRRRFQNWKLPMATHKVYDVVCFVLGPILIGSYLSDAYKQAHMHVYRYDDPSSLKLLLGIGLLAVGLLRKHWTKNK